MRRSVLAPLAIAFCCASTSGTAAVISANSGGFIIREEVQLKMRPARAWARLIEIGSWWDHEHTYSGSSSNLYLTHSPGGCWCEKLSNGGFVRHLDVVLVIPEKMLRFTGGLGPLQGIGATGALTFTLQESPAGSTTVVAEYSVVGFRPEGLTGLASAVDSVLGQQLARLAG